jgi:hypothetical protein
MVAMMVLGALKQSRRKSPDKRSGYDISRSADEAARLGEGITDVPTPAETFEVIWKDELVGTLSEARIDMGYMEGRFTAACSIAGERFALRASLLDARAVMSDFSLGARATIVSSSDPNRQRMTVVVLSLNEGSLFVRAFFSKEGVARVEANVPE